MSEKHNHDLFIKTAFEWAAESKCVSHHVGAVIVKDRRIISTGYNGTPPDLPNCCDVFDKDNFSRVKHIDWSKDHEIHAEMNAIMFAAKEGKAIDGCDLYCTISPCNECLKNIAMSGIRNVYYLYLYDRIELTPAMLKKVNVQEVPNAEYLKDWVVKNDLLYIPKQRILEQEMNRGNFKALIYKQTIDKGEISITQVLAEDSNGKIYKVFTPIYEKYIGREMDGYLVTHDNSILFKINS